MNEPIRVYKHSDGSDGRPKGAFAPGTSPGPGWKYGGNRNRQAIAALREYAAKLVKEESLPFKDPAEAFLYIGLTGRDPLNGRLKQQLLDNGLSSHVIAKLAPDTVALDTRLECLRIVLPYMRPKLHAMEVTGADGEPLFEDRERMQKLSRDPEVRGLMEQLTEKIVSSETTEAA